MSKNSPEKQEAEVATLGGGCFWCLEAVFEQFRGVERVVSGYAGGHVANPTYEQVCGKDTGHAEVVQVTFDPAAVSYRELLGVFFATHDPTTKDRQGNDVGPQYRSAVFYANEREKEIARKFIDGLTAKKAYPKPIVTTLEPLVEFFPAEAYHQNYVCQNPSQPYIQSVALPKVEKVREKFSEDLKPPK